MIVYRVVCPRRDVGPWSVGDVYWGSDPETGHHPSNGPCPREDTGRHIMDHEVCGCLSFEQMRKWFRPCHVQAMEKAGLVLRKLKVDGRRIKKGEWQCVFPREAAVVIDEKPVTFLYV